MKFKFPKLSKLPTLPNFPKLSLKKIKPPLIKHKVITLLSFYLTVFAFLAVSYRGHFISQMKSSSVRTVAEVLPTALPDTPTPPETTPSPTDATKNVLGTYDRSNSDYNTNYIQPSPFPTFPPLPTLVPFSNTNTPSNNSSSGSNTGNPNCTTGSGVANGWYSDVYPNPPISTNTGSVEIIVVLRDCFKQTAPVNDTLTISLVSGDPNAQINGNKLLATVTAQNGQANFFVTSQVTGTVTLSVQDTTKSFTVTDINNHNPVITFNSPSAAVPASSPTPTPTQIQTPSATSAPSQTPSASSTPAPTASATSTPAPTAADSPTPIPTPTIRR